MIDALLFWKSSTKQSCFCCRIGAFRQTRWQRCTLRRLYPQPDPGPRDRSRSYTAIKTAAGGPCAVRSLHPRSSCTRALLQPNLCVMRDQSGRPLVVLTYGSWCNSTHRRVIHTSTYWYHQRQPRGVQDSAWLKKPYELYEQGITIRMRHR